MAESSGDKSKLIYFLLAILQAIILAWSWRIEAAVAKGQISIATLEANYGSIMRELTEIKELVK